MALNSTSKPHHSTSELEACTFLHELSSKKSDRFYSSQGCAIATNFVTNL
ncbi:hypothetical protein H6H01_03820 [Nostoc calcicola FACHB-3891]|nr:hypothetical protein [Nostoc calcicola FACHB-3891]